MKQSEGLPWELVVIILCCLAALFWIPSCVPQGHVRTPTATSG
jgi:hypothetical protein